jgi:hypothetical protein
MQLRHKTLILALGIDLSNKRKLTMPSEQFKFQLKNRSNRTTFSPMRIHDSFVQETLKLKVAVLSLLYGDYHNEL